MQPQYDEVESELVTRSHGHTAQLERENAALQAEVASLQQRELTVAHPGKAVQNRAAELATLNERLQAEILRRQQAEAALRDSNRRFRYTFEQAAVGMVIDDLDGRWLQVNQRFCEMVGYSEAELMALTFADITHPDNLADDLTAIPKIIRGELPFYQTEKRYIRKDGSLLWANLTVSAVRNAIGDPICFITIMEDIGSRKEAELIARGQQEVLQSTLAYLATEPELDSFLSQVLATIVEQLHAPVADIWLHEEASPGKATPEKTRLHLTCWNDQIPNLPAPFAPGSIPLSVFQTCSAWASLNHQGKPFVYSDLPSHPDFNIFQAWSAVRDGVQTMLLCPLMFGADFLGVFVISHLQSRPYPPEALHLVGALAQQVVLAIQLTRLAEDAKQVAIVEDRNYLAREIHDTLAQTFNGISLQLDNAQYYATQNTAADSAIAWNIIKQVKNLARSGLAEARRSVWSLHPDADEYRDLAGSLQQQIAQLTHHTALQTNLTIVGEPQPMPPDIGMNLLRIGQEAISNTLHHAQAQTLQIELTFTAEAIALRIQDDGTGFDLQSARDRGGFGLLSMQQRCDRLGGKLTFHSEPSQGTGILVKIPLTSSLS